MSHKNSLYTCVKAISIHCFGVDYTPFPYEKKSRPFQLPKTGEVTQIKEHNLCNPSNDITKKSLALFSIFFSFFSFISIINEL